MKGCTNFLVSASGNIVFSPKGFSFVLFDTNWQKVYTYIYMNTNHDTYQQKIYYGITETKFKQRYADHAKSFRYEKHQSDTKLWMNYGALKEQLHSKYRMGYT